MERANEKMGVICEFQLATMVVNDSVTREAITRKQQRAFLEFIKADKHFNRYYEGIYILFHTGLRISEFVGLTVSDIDLENEESILTISYNEKGIYLRSYKNWQRYKNGSHDGRSTRMFSSYH